jgi:DNA end-binding protein Ku
MAHQKRYGIAQVVFSGREQLAAVRPVGGLLAMTLLSYADQVKKPAAFEQDVTHGAVSAEERRLAETLIEASTAEDFDLARYKDEYTSKLTKLIEAKAKGKKVVAPRSHEEPAVINLMDALRQSLNRTQKQAARKPARAAKAARTVGKRKTG